MIDKYEIPIPYSNSKSKALISVWWTGILLKKVSNRIFQDNTLSEAQLNILRILLNLKGPFTQNSISKMLLVDKSNVTMLIDKLEKKGLVTRERVEGDRRSYHLLLTKEGQVMAKKIDEQYMEIVNAIMEDFTEEEMEQLIRATKKMRKGIDVTVGMDV